MPDDHRNLPREADDAVERQAAEWFALREGGLSPTQQAEFERWQRADPRNARYNAEFAETWERLRHARSPVSITVHSALRRNRRRWAVGLTAAASLAVLATAWWRPSEARTPDFVMVAETAVGERRELKLPDGSIVQLSTATKVEVRLARQDRVVRLIAGEAHCDVAPDPARPFVVRTGLVEVRALGTAFGIRRQPTTLTVLLTEGKLQVQEATLGRSLLPTAVQDASALLAGNRFILPVDSRGAPAGPATVTPVSAAEMKRALAWRTSHLEFVAQPLVEIVAEFNRHNGHQLVIADARLGARRFGGTFATNDYEALVQLLENHFGVAVERGARETSLTLRADSPP